MALKFLLLKRVSMKQRLHFTRQLSILIGAGTPLIKALTTIHEQMPENYFRMGVCLMDLDRIRGDCQFIANRKRFLEEALSIKREISEAVLFEQSLYNRFFSEKYMRLPYKLVYANRINDYRRRESIDLILSSHDEIILDLKGWLNQSAFSLFFWAALLHTPWKEHAQQQFNQIKPLTPPRSEP